MKQMLHEISDGFGQTQDGTRFGFDLGMEPSQSVVLFFAEDKTRKLAIVKELRGEDAERFVEEQRKEQGR